MKQQTHLDLATACLIDADLDPKVARSATVRLLSTILVPSEAMVKAAGLPPE